MTSLTELFNPTFFLFLGILLLTISALVVYFESKMRDQNHKIASMLSLVSTLAEDMNVVKMSINNLVTTKTGGLSSVNFQQPLENYTLPESKKLIEVSDNEYDEHEDEKEDDEDEHEDEDEKDEDEKDEDNEDEGEDEDDNEDEDEDEDDNEDEDEDEGEDESDYEYEDEDEDDNNDNEFILEKVIEDEFEEDNNKQEYVKVLKINMNQNNDELTENNSLELHDLQYNDFLDNHLSIEQHETDISFVEANIQLLEEKETEIFNISSTEFKTININLEESEHNSLDYKKLSLQKLRSIVTDKGLSTDTSKLKKNEILKLLGVE
jgi:hypothetical protein